MGVEEKVIGPHKIPERKVEERYGTSIKDVLERIDMINRELGELSSTVRAMNETLARLDERTKSMEKRIDDWRDSTRIYFTVLGIIVGLVGGVVPIAITILTRIFP